MDGVKPEDELEEALLIAAFRKRQYIEVAKVQAIITAIVNPAKAAGAYTHFLKAMMPEYEEIRNQMDQGMMNVFQQELGNVFELSSGRNGWVAKRMKRE